MSYVVLARKYRPLRFADMVGQEHIGRTLGNAITQGRVHHAYLFAGARGLGKTTTARIFAKALVCKNGPSPEPCNACEECLAVTEGRSVDVIEIDGASNNSVDNIRSLREQVNYLPQTARCKVYIIDEVHMLSTAAFNALLKTLEEPPAHVNFVFATTEPHKVLATILSRTSRLDFRRVSIAETVAHLEDILRREQLGVDPAGLRLVARAAGGSVRDAMTLLDQVLAFARDPKAVTEAEARAVLGQAERTAVAGLVDAVLARDPDLVLERFDGLAAAGHDLTVLSIQMLEDLRDLTVARACRSREMFVDATADELEDLTRRAGAVDVATLAQTFDRLWRVVDRLPTARSQRLVLEMGLLGLAQREPLVPLGDLVERLTALAEGGSDGGSGDSGSARGGERPAARGAPGRAHRAAADPVPAFASPEPAPTRPTEPSTPARPIDARPEPGAANPQAHAGTPTPAVAETAFARELWALAQRNGAVGATAVREPVDRTDDVPPPDVAPDDVGPRPARRPEAPRRDRGADDRVRDTDDVPAAASTPAAAPRDVPPTNGAVAIAESGGGHDDDDVADLAMFSAWSQLVAAVRERDGYASAVLGEVGLVHYGGGVLRMAATRGSFAHTGLATPELRSQLEQAARALADGPVVLELVDLEPRLPDRPSLVLVDKRRRARLEARVAAEAREHPTIAVLLRDFDAKIAATRPLSE